MDILLLVLTAVLFQTLFGEGGALTASPQRQARASGDGSPLLGAAGSPFEIACPVGRIEPPSKTQRRRSRTASKPHPTYIEVGTKAHPTSVTVRDHHGRLVTGSDNGHRARGPGAATDASRSAQGRLLHHRNRRRPQSVTRNDEALASASPIG